MFLLLPSPPPIVHFCQSSEWKTSNWSLPTWLQSLKMSCVVNLQTVLLLLIMLSDKCGPWKHNFYLCTSSFQIGKSRCGCQKGNMCYPSCRTLCKLHLNSIELDHCTTKQPACKFVVQHWTTSQHYQKKAKKNIDENYAVCCIIQVPSAPQKEQVIKTLCFIWCLHRSMTRYLTK